MRQQVLCLPPGEAVSHDVTPDPRAGTAMAGPRRTLRPQRRWISCRTGGFEVRQCRTIRNMYTVIETPVYAKKADRLLTDEERETIAAFVSANPDAGVVVRGSGGVRKVRFGQDARGKSGGVRVIYYNRLENSQVWLLTVYGKGERSTIPAHELKTIREAIEHE